MSLQITILEEFCTTGITFERFFRSVGMDMVLNALIGINCLNILSISMKYIDITTHSNKK